MLAKLFGRNSEREETWDEKIERAQKDPNSIGNLAIELEWCTPSDIAEALKVQRERLHLGQILVDLGKLTTEQRDDLMIEQRIRTGERVSAEELHRHERNKFHRRVKAISSEFKDAGAAAKSTATTVLACVNGASALVSDP